MVSQSIDQPKYKFMRYKKMLETGVNHLIELTLGSLSNDDDDGNENVVSKYNFSFL